MRFYVEVEDCSGGGQLLAAYRLGVAAGQQRVTADLRRHLGAIEEQLAGIREALTGLEAPAVLEVRPPLRVVGDMEGNDRE